MIAATLRMVNDFQEFKDLVLSETELQDELAAIGDRDEFIDRAVEIGRRHSFRFEREDVAQAMLDARRSWFDRWK